MRVFENEIEAFLESLSEPVTFKESGNENKRDK